MGIERPERLTNFGIGQLIKRYLIDAQNSGSAIAHDTIGIARNVRVQSMYFVW